MVKKRTKPLWWHSSLTVWKIIYTKEVLENCRIPWQIQAGINKALSDKPFAYTRAKKIRHEWLEEVTVYNVLYQLVCLVDTVDDEEFFVIKTVRAIKNKSKISDKKGEKICKQRGLK